MVPTYEKEATMAVTFQAAREAVAQYARGLFPTTRGTFYVAPWGRSDATHWEVPAGAKEAMVDGDDSFIIMDWPFFLVDKTTGQVEAWSYLDAVDRVERMAHVGERPGVQ